MDLQSFKYYSENFNLVPVYRTISADMLTPVLAYLRIRQNSYNSFLLESVEGPSNRARYSFIGKDPLKIISNKNVNLNVNINGHSEKFTGSVFDYIRNELSLYSQPVIEELPDFTGGLVGYIGYENISLIENVIKFNSAPSDNHDSVLGVYDTILAFDHYKHQIILITNVRIEDKNEAEKYYKTAQERLSKLQRELRMPGNYISDFKASGETSAGFDKEKFYASVKSCKSDIINGDIFQIVLSNRFSTEFSGDPFNVYRALRMINPSPYMYFLESESNLRIIGSSPEDLVKVKDRKVYTLPIAGTRRRGRSNEEDKELETNLLSDPKELAEHTMLVDLGRNDLGRVCKFGTVKVTEMMQVRRYSHVMHLVSRVEGELADDKDCVDALKSCFPAGTVTGAPKIKAVQLIDKYEKNARNVYAGAVGYFDFSGNMDMCIAIRTLFTKNNMLFWQSGAGIVADSVPELEAKEILNKSEAMLNAVKYAEVIDESPGNR